MVELEVDGCLLVCSASGCRESHDLQNVLVSDQHSALLCPEHAKQYYQPICKICKLNATCQHNFDYQCIEANNFFKNKE